MKYEISNVVVTVYFSENEIDLRKLDSILFSKYNIKSTYNSIGLGTVKILEFTINDIKFRVFEKGKVIVIIPKSETIESFQQKLNEAIQFLQKIKEEYFK